MITIRMTTMMATVTPTPIPTFLLLSEPAPGEFVPAEVVVS